MDRPRRLDTDAAWRLGTVSEALMLRALRRRRTGTARPPGTGLDRATDCSSSWSVRGRCRRLRDRCRPPASDVLDATGRPRRPSAAQADYDGFRSSRATNRHCRDPVTSATDVLGHAFVCTSRRADLWPGATRPPPWPPIRPPGLVAQAPVPQNLLTGRPSPEAIGPGRSEELTLENDTVPGHEEQFSHLDAHGLSATVAAAQAAFAAIQPLARLVAPGLTADVATRFGSLATQVDALGPTDHGRTTFTSVAAAGSQPGHTTERCWPA